MHSDVNIVTHIYNKLSLKKKMKASIHAGTHCMHGLHGSGGRLTQRPNKIATDKKSMQKGNQKGPTGHQFGYIRYLIRQLKPQLTKWKSGVLRLI